mgnify:CR=1 FL=1
MTTPLVRCCSRADAWRWCQLLAADALGGDADAARLLPRALAHWMDCR